MKLDFDLEISTWPPGGDFWGILFENAPDPKLALSKGFSLLPEMSFS